MYNYNVPIKEKIEGIIIEEGDWGGNKGGKGVIWGIEMKHNVFCTLWICQNESHNYVKPCALIKT